MPKAFGCSYIEYGMFINDRSLKIHILSAIPDHKYLLYTVYKFLLIPIDSFA